MNIVKLNVEQKKLFGEKLIELANLAMAGLVFGQVVAGTKSTEMAVVGVVLFVYLYWFAYLITKDMRR